MPTNNPRVSITLAPADLAVIDRFAAALDTPRATIIAGLVQASLPEIAKAAELIELANLAPRKVQQELVQGLSAATEQVMGSLHGFHGAYRKAMDAASGKRPQAAGSGRKELAPGRSRPPSGPPPTNRGVKSTRKGGR